MKPRVRYRKNTDRKRGDKDENFRQDEYHRHDRHDDVPGFSNNLYF